MGMPAKTLKFKPSKDDSIDFEKNDGKKSKAFSSEISDSLQQVSRFDGNFESNLELMRKLRILLIQCLQICEGAYRAKPTQGNSYALTNMISQVREITDRLESAIDYKEVSNVIAIEVIQPFIEKLILDLGSIISDEVDNCSKNDKKVVSKTINNIYKKFGAKIEVKLPALQKKVVTRMLELTK